MGTHCPLLLLSFGKLQDKQQPAIAPFGAADEEGAALTQDRIGLDEDLLLTPELEVELHAAAVGGAFGVELHKEVLGGHHPALVLAEDVLIVLADDLVPGEGKDFG